MNESITTHITMFDISSYALDCAVETHANKGHLAVVEAAKMYLKFLIDHSGAKLDEIETINTTH